MKFLELPGRVVPAVLEVALPKFHHARWTTGYTGLPRTISELLRNNPGWIPHDLLAWCGWSVVDALGVGSDIESYRRYIQSSRPNGVSPRMVMCEAMWGGSVTAQRPIWPLVGP